MAFATKLEAAKRTSDSVRPSQHHWNGHFDGSSSQVETFGQPLKHGATFINELDTRSVRDVNGCIRGNPDIEI